MSLSPQTQYIDLCLDIVPSGRRLSLNPHIPGRITFDFSLLSLGIEDWDILQHLFFDYLTNLFNHCTLIFNERLSSHSHVLRRIIVIIYFELCYIGPRISSSLICYICIGGGRMGVSNQGQKDFIDIFYRLIRSIIWSD